LGVRDERGYFREKDWFIWGEFLLGFLELLFCPCGSSRGWIKLER
jgi:hypothetical protein